MTSAAVGNRLTGLSATLLPSLQASSITLRHLGVHDSLHLSMGAPACHETPGITMFTSANSPDHFAVNANDTQGNLPVLGTVSL